MKRVFSSLLVTLMVLVSSALARDLTTIGGEVFKNITVQSKDAIGILESRLDIAIVLSDVDMPRGIDGMELAALIRHRWPPIDIVIVSGHVRPSAGELPDRALFFSKPYRESLVVNALKSFIN